MKRYEKYKDSGVNYIGEIPNSWSTLKMKFLFKDVSIKNKPEMELLSVTQDKGVVPRSMVENRMVMPNGNLESFKVISEGDFAISLRSFEGGLEYSAYDGIISPAYTVLKSQKKINNYYFKYYFKSKIFISELQLSVVGIREGKNISYEELKYSHVPTPPLPEQQAIAEFLDDKTAKIDQTISLKQKEINLLKERRQILIQKAVTKGLNDQVKMKDSGVDWIGKIPEHWEVRKLRNCLRAVSIKNRADLPLLSITRERGVIIRNLDDQEGNHNFIPDDLSGYKVIRKGEFGMNKMKAWQGSYGISDYDGIVSPAYFIFEVTDKFNPAYFHLAIRSKVYVPLFSNASDGVRIGQWDLNKNRMNEIPFFIPSSDEQIEIVTYLRNLDEKIATATAIKEQEIEKLKEYRTVLIDNVVTGKMKVN